MTYPRSPFDRAVADTMHWGRFIDKVRQHLAGELPDEFVSALGHQYGVDGQFLEHFDLTLEEVSEAVTCNNDLELADLLTKVVEDFQSKRRSWNELAPKLGRRGFPMDRMLKIAMKCLYKGYEWSPEMSVFELDRRKKPQGLLDSSGFEMM